VSPNQWPEKPSTPANGGAREQGHGAVATDAAIERLRLAEAAPNGEDTPPRPAVARAVVEWFAAHGHRRRDRMVPLPCALA
jgi:hypothetical protein